jgi:hypothetical protein
MRVRRGARNTDVTNWALSSAILPQDEAISCFSDHLAYVGRTECGHGPVIDLAVSDQRADVHDGVVDVLGNLLPSAARTSARLAPRHAEPYRNKRPTFIKSAPACSLSTKLQSSQANSGCMRPELDRVLQRSWAGRPAIVPACPGPSMILLDACWLPHGVARLPEKLGRVA